MRLLVSVAVVAFATMLMATQWDIKIVDSLSGSCTSEQMQWFYSNKCKSLSAICYIVCECVNYAC